MTERTFKVMNEYSGQSEMLNEQEYKLFFWIKESEKNENYDDMQKGLDKFSRLNPKAYMTLLDQISIEVPNQISKLKDH